MRNSAVLRHNWARTLALAFLVSGCASDIEGHDRRVWTAVSAAIDFNLLGPVGQEICAFSALRNQLTREQVDGLDMLLLHDGVGGAACDSYTYRVTVQARDGSSTRYVATAAACSSMPILLFEEFDAWAHSTPCSLQAAQR